MTVPVLAPDERAVRAHLGGSRFQAGVEAGRWRLLYVVWPIATVAVSAAPRNGAPPEFAIRFELSGYPNTAPTGGIRDVDTDASLPADRRPKGNSIGQVFRSDGWLGGATAMYAPWDRMGLQAHPDWARKYPRSAWNSRRDLTFILENIHKLLNVDDYLGI